jgi:hypothetical protein
MIVFLFNKNVYHKSPSWWQLYLKTSKKLKDLPNRLPNMT